jgi:hypothetical protein
MTQELPKVARPDFWLTTTSLLWLCTIVLGTFTHYRLCMKCSCVYGRQQHQVFLSVGHDATRTASTMTQTQRSWFPSSQENIWIVNQNWCICFNCHVLKYFNFVFYHQLIRSQWPCGLRRVSAAVRLLRFLSRAWIFVCCECRVLSGRGLCDELIARPEEFYRLWCVVVYDLKISRMVVGPQRQGGGGSEDINPSHNLTTDKWPRVINKFEKSCVEFWGFIDQFKKLCVGFWGFIDQFEKSCVEFWGLIEQFKKSCLEFWGLIDQFEKSCVEF